MLGRSVRGEGKEGGQFWGIPARQGVTGTVQEGSAGGGCGGRWFAKAGKVRSASAGWAEIKEVMWGWNAGKGERVETKVE